MKLNFGSEAIMFIFILGLLFLTVIQPTFYPPGSSSPPSSGPTATPAPGEPTATPTVPPTVPTPTPTTPAANDAAFFTINPSDSTIQKGDTLTIEVVLNTGDFEIDGVDLVLSFEPESLEAKSVTPKISSLDYNEPVVDNNAGTIKVSAAGRIQNNAVVGFRGAGEYAQIEFLALKATNSTTISFTGGDKGSHTSNATGDHLDLTKCLPGNYTITN